MSKISHKGLADRVSIRLARKSDFVKYAALIQKSAEAAYTNAKLGYTSDLFSKKVLSSAGMQGWMKSNLYPKPGQITWVAFLGSRMVGAMTVSSGRRRDEFRTLYIAPDVQGMGIGRVLFRRALEYSMRKEAILTMYPHNLKTLRIYRKWGFKKYGKSGYHHWLAWPKGVRMKYIYMLLDRRGAEKLYRHLLGR